jgi:hypothetical protein
MFIIVQLVTSAEGAIEKVVSCDGSAGLDVLNAACELAFQIPANTISLSYAGEALAADVPLNAQIADGATLTLTVVAASVKKFHLSDVPANVRYVCAYICQVQMGFVKAFL